MYNKSLLRFWQFLLKLTLSSSFKNTFWNITKSVNNEENANKITLTGQDESDESKKPVAAPEDDACKDDVPDEG